MTQLSLVLLVLVIFGGYIADAREIHYKFTCPGAKADVGIYTWTATQHGDYFVLACCKLAGGFRLVDVNGNIFCCSGEAHCWGSNYDTCTCTGGKADTIRPLSATTLEVVS